MIIAFALSFAGLLGITVFVISKVPSLTTLGEKDYIQTENPEEKIEQKIKTEIKGILEDLLQKILQSIRKIIVRIENITTGWLYALKRRKKKKKEKSD